MSSVTLGCSSIPVARHICYLRQSKLRVITVVDRGGAAGAPPIPKGPNSFVFVSVSAEKCPHGRLAPPPPHPNGKSWIRS